MQQIEIDKVNALLAEWRAQVWPQLKFRPVSDGCISRFEMIGLRDRWSTTPEVILSLSTGGHPYYTTETVVENLKEVEDKFYRLLSIDGVVPDGQLSYRGAFWELLPHQGLFATLCYTNNVVLVSYREHYIVEKHLK